MDQPTEYPRGTLYDTIGADLISRALTGLNARHLRHLCSGRVIAKPFTHVRDTLIIERWMRLVAEAEYGHLYTSETPGHQPPRKKDQLPRARFEDSIRRRAEWVFAHWTGAKVEGRRRGGLNGTATQRRLGGKRGRTPKYTYATIQPYLNIPKAARMARVLEETGMSAATYYRLMAAAPATQAANAQREADRRARDGELFALLDGDPSMEEVVKLLGASRGVEAVPLPDNWATRWNVMERQLRAERVDIFQGIEL
jgi:hypothetical protein